MTFIIMRYKNGAVAITTSKGATHFWTASKFTERKLSNAKAELVKAFKGASFEEWREK